MSKGKPKSRLRLHVTLPAAMSQEVRRLAGDAAIFDGPEDFVVHAVREAIHHWRKARPDPEAGYDYPEDV